MKAQLKYIWKLKNKIPFFYFLFFFTLFVIFVVYDMNNHKQRVSIAVGKTGGAYYVYAQQYKRLLKKYGVELDIHTTAGAKETQELLINDKVDFAFLQEGLERTNEGILALANVAHEPIWVLYRDTNISNFHDLKDKRINICNPHSGTYPVARQLLVELLEMDEKNLKMNNVKEAFQLLRNGKIDAMFYVIARSSKTLDSMIRTEGIHILNFEEASSMRKALIKDDMNSSKNSYFKTIVVKKYSIDFVHKIPKQDKTMLVKRTILGTKTASNAMVRLFLKVAQKVHSQEAFFHEEKHFLSTNGFKYKQHEASKRYFENPLHRYESSELLKKLSPKYYYWLAQTLKKIENTILTFIVLISLIGFYIEVIHPLIKMRTRKRIKDWYLKINELDTNMEKFSLEALRKNKSELEQIAIEMHNTDDIDAAHLEAYYTLQQQVHDMIENFERCLEGKCAKEILT